MKIDFDKVIARVANLDVIAGIIFLAIEVRQNTQSLGVNAYQTLMSEISDMANLYVTNPEFAARMENWLRLSAEELADTDFSPEEVYSTSGFLLGLTRHRNLAYYQYELGIISQERLGSAISPLQARLCTLLYQALVPDTWWRRCGFDRRLPRISRNAHA